MTHEKLEDFMKSDIQDDDYYLSENLREICHSTYNEEYLLTGKHRTLLDKKLEDLIPQAYTKIDYRTPILNTLHEETLFYIFYMNPKDKLQENAFFMLLDMGYKYCTILKSFLWFDFEVLVDNLRHEVLLFDPFSWEKVSREVSFDKDFVSSLVYRNVRFVRGSAN